ncbi:MULTISPECIES: glycosyltransferase [unclassified Roseitalea]|uniref:glycosyltransferase family 2 protein n=1 Tax=unclassified Roseitalea TaxID=2639107 RepID=UPI00273F0C7D|nr:MULTISPECIES: glycosyltransferase [unclassified Roseitalea]
MKQRLADNISLVAQTPGLDAGAIEVVVTVPTFRRPEHLVRTLDSLKAQTTERPFAVIVIENEAEERAGARAVADLFEDGTHKGLVIVAHDRGNCHAYNAGWFTALTAFANLRALCVIDDDEIASPGWIEALCATSARFDAALVGGPQLPVFETGSNGKWTRHPVFTPHYHATGPVPALFSSGNLLVRRDVLQAMAQPFFDPVFNFTGGGDADFLARARDAGFTAAWCQEAAVRESIPRTRVSRRWIRDRALRNGQLSALIAHRRRANARLGRVTTIAESLALALAALPRALAGFARSGCLLNALYPVHIAAGRILSEFGYAHEQYRNPAD